MDNSTAPPHGVEGGGKLLPCPFCGSGLAREPGRFIQASFSGVEMRPTIFGHGVWCGTCGAEGPPHDTEAQAAAAWNTRSLPTGGDDA
jgi:hypothetical protein